MQRSWINAIKGFFLAVVVFSTAMLIWMISTLEPFWRHAPTYTALGILIFAGVMAIITICASIHFDKGEANIILRSKK